VGWRRRDEAGDRGGQWQSAGAVRGGGGATITSSVAEAMWSRLGVFFGGGGGGWFGDRRRRGGAGGDGWMVDGAGGVRRRRTGRSQRPEEEDGERSHTAEGRRYRCRR
jgi:hypothetical protein